MQTPFSQTLDNPTPPRPSPRVDAAWRVLCWTLAAILAAGWVYLAASITVPDAAGRIGGGR